MTMLMISGLMAVWVIGLVVALALCRSAAEGDLPLDPDSPVVERGPGAASWQPVSHA